MLNKSWVMFSFLFVVFCPSLSASENEPPLSLEIHALTSQGQVGKPLSVEARVSNISQEDQAIWLDACGGKGWQTDHEGITVGQPCDPRMGAVPSQVTLKSGHSLEPMWLFGKGPTVEKGINLIVQNSVPPGTVTFRVGVEPVGHEVVWSNPITVEIAPEEG